MANQTVTIAGVTFSNVPSVDITKSGGGTAKFVEISDTTAVEHNVLNGKDFYLSTGSKVTGTATMATATVSSQKLTLTDGFPVNSTSLLPIVIRPDAEFVKSWTADFTLASKSINIPAYSTSATTLLASSNLETYVADQLTYNYLLSVELLTIPTYNINTRAKGREEYVYTAALYEFLYQPSGTIKSLDGLTSYGQYSHLLAVGNCSRFVYWSSGTAITPYTSNTYGLCMASTSPTIGNNKNITIKSPTVTIRGHTTYLTQTYWNALTTQSRCQYVIKLYRVPKTNTIKGWEMQSSLDYITDCIENNNNTLR